MKKLVSLIIGLALFASASFAQTNVPATPWYKDIVKIQTIAVQTNLLVAAYPSYAPNLVVDGKKKPWGAGIAALYPLTQNAFTGVRFDYLADEFFAPTVDVGLQIPIKVFNKVTVVPFAHTGLNYMASGGGAKNGDVGGILGGGFDVKIAAFKSTSLHLFYAYERWTLFDTGIHHPGVMVQFNF